MKTKGDKKDVGSIQKGSMDSYELYWEAGKERNAESFLGHNPTAGSRNPILSARDRLVKVLHSLDRTINWRYWDLRDKYDVLWKETGLLWEELKKGGSDAIRTKSHKRTVRSTKR